MNLCWQIGKVEHVSFLHFGSLNPPLEFPSPVQVDMHSMPCCAIHEISFPA